MTFTSSRAVSDPMEFVVEKEGSAAKVADAVEIMFKTDYFKLDNSARMYGQ